MIETIATLGFVWVAGWVQKHKTKIDHKKWGPLVNVALATAGTAVAAGHVDAEVIKNGVQLAAMAELGLAGGKAAVRGGKSFVGKAATIE